MTEVELAKFIYEHLRADHKHGDGQNYVDAPRLNLAVIDGTFDLVALAKAILSESSARRSVDLGGDI